MYTGDSTQSAHLLLKCNANATFHMFGASGESLWQYLDENYYRLSQTHTVITRHTSARDVHAACPIHIRIQLRRIIIIIIVVGLLTYYKCRGCYDKIGAHVPMHPIDLLQCCRRMRAFALNSVKYFHADDLYDSNVDCCCCCCDCDCDYYSSLLFDN